MNVVDRGRWGCSHNRQRRTCDNGQRVNNDIIEARIFAALKTEMLTPELIRVFIKEYTEAKKRLRQGKAQAAATAGKRTADLKGKIARAVDAIIEGKASPALTARLGEMEKELKTIETQITAAPVNNVIDWHPNLADIYRDRLEELQKHLREADTDPDLKQTAKMALGSLIERITVTPGGKIGNFALTVDGALGGLMGLADPARIGEAPVVLAMVAEEGLEPPTRGL